jgi:hypothetical protein
MISPSESNPEEHRDPSSTTCGTAWAVAVAGAAPGWV